MTEAEIYQIIADSNERRVYKHWHASSIGDCPKAHYLKRIGQPPIVVPSAAKILRWDVGHKIEETIRPHLQKIYPNMISNQRMLETKEYDLTGEFDNYNPDTKELMEIKSVHPRGIDHLNRENKPHLHYVLQNHAYALMMDEVDGIKVEKISFLYIGLDGRLKAFTIKVQKQYLDNVKKRLSVLNKAWEKQKAPNCICRKDGNWNKNHPLWGPSMKWCDYRDEENNKCCVERSENGA
jgi:hypothetical protein